MTKLAFASGTEPGASILVGPGLAGPTVMIPSIPDCSAAGVCPMEAQTAITMNPQLPSTFRNLIVQFIRGVPKSSTNDNVMTSTHLALDDAFAASKILGSSHG